MDTTRRRVLVITIGCFLAFLLFGALEAVKGPTLPALIDEMGYSNAAGGAIVTAGYFGFLIASILTGYISDRIGKKAAPVIAAACFLAGIFGYASAAGYPLFIASYFLIGAAGGAVELGCNYIIIDVQKKPGMHLNLLAFFYGAGAMLAPLYAGEILQGGGSWRNAYLYLLPAVVLMLVYFLVARYPAGRGEDGPRRFDLGELARIAFTRRMFWIYVLVFAYVASEVGMATWMVRYLDRFRGIPPDSGAVWLSLFFAGIMAGRFIGSFFVERVGELRIMGVSALLTLACIAAGLAGPDWLVFLLPMTGLFYSIILPTAIAYVSKMQKDNLGPLLGFLICFIGLGGMAGPWAIGALNDWAGIGAGLGAAAVFCLLVVLSLGVLSRDAKAAGAKE